LQQFDGNILGPRILGDSIGLPAFWVIFAILLFGGYFGVFGMFVGVPAFAVIYSVLKIWMEGRLSRKNMPTDTKSYASEDHPLL
ncbi:MAG TPA: AI-2E family transporter, partial [Ruminococcaceae bacterium]|nr:AI-2E family transporter [Oscillospiraceae bacterium]